MDRIVAIVLGSALVGGAALPQPPDDQEEQDRRYQERLERRREFPPLPADPEAAAGERRDRLVAAADALVRDRNFAFAQAVGVEVRTDDPRLDALAAADLLAAFYRHFDATLATRVVPAPSAAPSRFYLLWSLAEFRSLATGQAWVEEHAVHALDVSAVHSDGVAPGDLADALVHEAAHLRFGARVLPGVVPPPWLDEGWADYFGATLQDDDGAFRDGRIGGKSAALFRSGRVPKSAGARKRLDALDRAARKTPSWTIDDVLRIADPATFFGDGVELHRAASFAAVHYLVHGDGGAHADAFFSWMAGLRDGPSDPDRLYRVVGTDRAGFHAAVVRHARTLR